MNTSKEIGSRLMFNCKECGSEFYKFPSQVREKAVYGRFCNKHCLGRFRSKNLVREKAANYKTGSRRSREYIEVEAHWHPNSNGRGYVFLHRLLAEVKAGRFLLDGEVVHHKDGNSRNNHWSNLEITTQSAHAREHIKERKRDKYGRI